MTRSLIEKIVIIAVAAVFAIAMGLVFLISYASYKSSLPVVAKIVSIEFDIDENIEPGQTFKDISPEVTAVYDNGKREELAKTAYTVTFSPSLGESGTAVNARYTCKVTLNGSKDVFAEKHIKVSTRLEAENAVIVNGAARTENGYTFAGGFNPDKNGDGYVEFTIPCFGNVTTDLELCVSNGNLKLDEGANTSWMEPLQVNKIAELSVNGTPINIPDTVVCPGTETTTFDNWAALYSIFNNFTFEDVPLNDGDNKVRFTLKSSSEIKNSWGETPTMNIDYVQVVPVGGEAYEGAKVISAEYNGDSEVTIASNETLGSAISGGDYPVTYICDNGLIYYAGIDEFDVSVTPSVSLGSIGRIGEQYKIEAKLKNGDVGFSINVSVSNVLEAENATIVGGNSVTENGQTFAGTFNTNKYDANYVEFTFDYYKAETRDITLRVSNGYLLQDEETDLYHMGELQLNTIMDITVNGGAYALADDVKLEASAENSNATVLYGNFEDVVLKGVSLKEGTNTIRVALKLSTADQTTCWPNSGSYGLEFESPVVNIDKITIAEDESNEG